MANTKKTCGLRPIDQPFGNVRVTHYKAVTGNELYRYMPVNLNASGYIEAATLGSDNTLIGSIVGFMDGDWAPVDEDYSGYVAANPSSVDSNGYINVLVADDPYQLFVIEEDTGGSALTIAAIGAGVDMAFLATSGSTLSGVCNVVLDRSTVGTNTGQQLALVKLWDKDDNAYGNYAKWIVRIHNHRLNPPNQAGVSAVV